MTRDLYNLNLLAKLMVLHYQILFNLIIAAIAEAILMRISSEQVPSSHVIATRDLNLVTSSSFWSFMLICTDVVPAVGHDLALFCADFQSICRCFVYESGGEVLKFTVATAHKIHVAGKS